MSGWDLGLLEEDMGQEGAILKWGAGLRAEGRGCVRKWGDRDILSEQNPGMKKLSAEKNLYFGIPPHHVHVCKYANTGLSLFYSKKLLLLPPGTMGLVHMQFNRNIWSTRMAVVPYEWFWPFFSCVCVHMCVHVYVFCVSVYMYVLCCFHVCMCLCIHGCLQVFVHV